AGSAGVDVTTAVDTTLTSTAVHLIDMSIKGPLGQGLCTLLLGRSSSSCQGSFVLPGVIDADYTGVMKAIVYTLTPPVSIPAGSWIAQLVPFHSCVLNPGKSVQGDGGFGSTGQSQVYFAMDITKPEKMGTLTRRGHKFMLKAVFDTRADITIVS
ncbi:POK9 protein, partial [Pomatorhinus ruficollis]|nr:POK9 protein [Pomatorhinus ruficollis]